MSYSSFFWEGFEKKADIQKAPLILPEQKMPPLEDLPNNPENLELPGPIGNESKRIPGQHPVPG